MGISQVLCLVLAIVRDTFAVEWDIRIITSKKWSMEQNLTIMFHGRLIDRTITTHFNKASLGLARVDIPDLTRPSLIEVFRQDLTTEVWKSLKLSMNSSSQYFTFECECDGSSLSETLHPKEDEWTLNATTGPNTDDKSTATFVLTVWDSAGANSTYKFDGNFEPNEVTTYELLIPLNDITRYHIRNREQQDGWGCKLLVFTHVMTCRSFTFVCKTVLIDFITSNYPLEGNECPTGNKTIIPTSTVATTKATTIPTTNSVAIPSTSAATTFTTTISTTTSVATPTTAATTTTTTISTTTSVATPTTAATTATTRIPTTTSVATPTTAATTTTTRIPTTTSIAIPTTAATTTTTTFPTTTSVATPTTAATTTTTRIPTTTSVAIPTTAATTTTTTFPTTTSVATPTTAATTTTTTIPTTTSVATPTTAATATATTNTTTTSIAIPITIPTATTTTTNIPTFTTGPTFTDGQPVLPCCPCLQQKPAVNMTSNQLETVINELKTELSVNKTALSATIRKKTSAVDARASSKAIGSMGAMLLAIPIIFVVTLDLMKLNKTQKSKQIP